MTGDSPEARTLVVTGSSAGGIEALSTIVSSLSADFQAPIVVAQHLDPNFHSRLGEILRGRTSLAVKLVESHEKLEPGTVYVVPSGHDVEIEDGEVAVKPGGPKRRIKPSVDRLFRSAAKTYGERLIAVILSGMGTDGVAGAREVKERGGTVVIQEPSSAEYPSMPLALPPTLVDFTRKLDAIGPLIEELVSRPMIGGEENGEHALRALLVRVRDRSGIDFLKYKMPTIRRRLARLMAAAGVRTFEEYQHYLQRNPEAYERLVSAFLIKVTGFFRDAELYEYLRDQVLPQLIEAARENEHELRIWSAGCATGEEAYSLAILVAELLRDEADAFNVRIFATDLEEEAIAFARRGIYARDAFEEIPDELVARYFTNIGDACEVGKKIRSMTIFGQHDLGQRSPFPRIDLVFCRNVLIYFTKELQQHALQLFAFSLRNGGYLVLGKAETTNPAPGYFKPLNTMMKVFQRQGERVLIPPSHLHDTSQPPPHAHKRPGFAVPSTKRVAEPRPSSSEFIGNLIFSSPIGVVVVDRHYDIVSINRAARSLLNVHGVGIGEDLIHTAAAVEPNALREIIDAVLRNEASDFGREVTVRGASGEADTYVQIAAYPYREPDGSAAVANAVLVMMDVSATARGHRQLERETQEQRTLLAELTGRADALTQRQRALLEANDELTTANMELRSGNEQLLISLEEAASSTEEIETLNEEMQATNEELETLNEELQATVEELNTTNDELEARGRTLEEAGKTREGALHQAEAEREVFKAALDGLEFPIAVLSDAGALVFRNPAFERLMKRVSVRANGRSVALHDLPIAQIDEATPLSATARDEDGNDREFETRLRGVATDAGQRWIVEFRPQTSEVGPSTDGG